MPKETLHPDVRFGTSFLDEKYRDKAVKGEILSDKIDAELFLKRPADGKLISFMRRNTYIYETINELNVEIQNHPNFLYPDEEAIFLSMYFDMFGILGSDKNIFLTDLMFTNRLDESKKVEFKVSNNSNGFFIKPKTRDNDRKSTSFLNLEFNRFEENHMITRPYEYQGMTYWENGDTILGYTVTTTGILPDGSYTEVKSSGVSSIRTNENTLVEFPKNYNYGLKEITSISVYIDYLKFPKLQMMYEIYMANPPEYTYPFNEIIEVDYAANIKTLEIWSFVNQKEDVPAKNTNMFLNQILSIDYLIEIMQKVKKVGDGNGVIPSVTRPSAINWSTNNAWAELIRSVSSGNTTINNNTEVTIEDLEKYLYYIKYVNTEFTFDENNENGLLVVEV